MKTYHVLSTKRPAIIRVEMVEHQVKFRQEWYKERRVTIIRPYYQIRDEWGNEVFATYSEEEFLNKVDEIDESLDYGDYQFYVQDDVMVDGVFEGFKNQRPYCISY